MAVTARRVPGEGRVVLRAEGVTVEVAGRRLLDGVGIDVRAGELLSLVGPNGAGKSTLLGVLAGDIRPTSGRVVLDDADLRRRDVGELSRLRALLPQSHTVSFPFTVREVVTMGRAPWAGRHGGDDDEAIVAGAMAATDVASLAERTVPTLSGGEKARAALSRVLAQQTAMILLDEPTAAVDLRHQEIVLSLARGLADAGAAVVVVLHDLELAAAFSDRLVMLADGRVRADGPPDDVLTAELVGEIYRCPVLVGRHPETGDLLVTPDRRRAPSSPDPHSPRTPAHPVHPEEIS